MAPAPNSTNIYFCPNDKKSRDIYFEDLDIISGKDFGLRAKFAADQTEATEAIDNFQINAKGNYLNLIATDPIKLGNSWSINIEYSDRDGKTDSKYFNVKTCSSCKYNNDGSCNEAKAVVAGMPQQLWIAVILAICCSLLAFITFLAWNHKRKSKHIHDLPFQKGNEDDIRENVIQYAEEAGEQDAADPTIGYRAVQKNSRYEEAANEVAKLKRCTSEDNFNGAPWDSRLLYKYEGSNSVLNSLSSINTNMTDRSIDLRGLGSQFGLVKQLFHSSVPGTLHRSIKIEIDSDNHCRSFLN